MFRSSSSQRTKRNIGPIETLASLALILTAIVTVRGSEERMQADAAPLTEFDEKNFGNFLGSKHWKHFVSEDVQVSEEKKKSAAIEFIQLFHPQQFSYITVSNDGRISSTTSATEPNSLFLVDKANGTLSLENVGTCRLLCIRKSGNVYTKPSNKGEAECRFRSFLARKNLPTVVDRVSIQSAVHKDKGQVLTLARNGIHGGAEWRAQWLSKNEVTPDMTFEVPKVSLTKSDFKDSYYDPQSRQKYCQKMWDNERQARSHHSHVSWQEESENYLKEHDKCGDAKCREEIHKKCLEQGQKVHGKSGFFWIQDCVFPVQIANALVRRGGKCWKLTDFREIRRCLRQRRTECKATLRRKKPNWRRKKVANKCRKRQKVEKCLVNRRILARKRRKPWKLKRARRICKKSVF